MASARTDAVTGLAQAADGDLVERRAPPSNVPGRSIEPPPPPGPPALDDAKLPPGSAAFPAPGSAIEYSGREDMFDSEGDIVASRATQTSLLYGGNATDVPHWTAWCTLTEDAGGPAPETVEVESREDAPHVAMDALDEPVQPGSELVLDVGDGCSFATAGATFRLVATPVVAGRRALDFERTEPAEGSMRLVVDQETGIVLSWSRVEPGEEGERRSSAQLTRTNAFAWTPPVLAPPELQPVDDTVEQETP